MRPIRYHDLRHMFASLAINAGVRMETLAKAMGHSAVATTARYAHLRTETVRDEFAKVGRTLPVAK